MKHGKNPNVAQAMLIKAKGLIPSEWLVTKNTSDTLEIVKRGTRETITLAKG